MKGIKRGRGRPRHLRREKSACLRTGTRASFLSGIAMPGSTFKATRKKKEKKKKWRKEGLDFPIPLASTATTTATGRTTDDDGLANAF